MFGKWSSLSAAALSAALLFAPRPAQAQQNSMIFPWNSGYTDYNQAGYYSEEQYVTDYTGEPTAEAVPGYTYYAEPYYYYASQWPPAYVGSQTYPYAFSPAATEEEQEEPYGADRAAITVRLPADAQLWFEGSRTSETGSDRQFVSPPLTPGKMYTYDVRAQWTDANGKPVERTYQIQVEAGRRTILDLNHPTTPVSVPIRR